MEFDLSNDEMLDLDVEGRTTIVDCGLFVLINLYCPNETNDLRLLYKVSFNALLEARIRLLISSGREVVVVGDMNICPYEIDHCDPDKRAKESGDGACAYGDHPARKWMRKMCDLDGGGLLVDVTRKFWPDRKYMYTCEWFHFSLSMILEPGA